MNEQKDVFTVAEWFEAFAFGAPVTLIYYDPKEGAFFDVGTYDGNGNGEKFAECFVNDWEQERLDLGGAVLLYCND